MIRRALATPSEFTEAREAAPWRRLDWTMIAVVVLLTLFGWMALRGGAEGNPALLAVAQKQGVWLLAAGLLAVALQGFDYTRLLPVIPVAYFVNLVVLVAVLLHGRTINGARSWFDFGPISFQPSETMKIIAVLMCAQWLALRAGRTGWAEVVGPAAILGVPAALILLQPDLGTAIVFFVIYVGMVFWAGVPARVLGALFLAVALGAAAVYPVLKPYQKERIRVFVDPSRDRLGRGYNVHQSKIAIGNGGIFGQGWGQGTQSTRRFLPEHHTDFIFASTSEQFGFVGIAAVAGLFLALATRILRTIEAARDRFGAFLVAGLAAMLLTHVTLNVGMTFGLVPVTGLPLPFFSYGGSFLLSTGAVVGLILNVGSRPFTFVR